MPSAEPAKPSNAGTESLEVEAASVGPKRPISFFRDLEIPDDLPRYVIDGGKLAGSGFEAQEPAEDSDQRLSEIIDDVRRNEALYKNLAVESVQTYHKFDPQPYYPGSTFIEHLDSRSIEHSAMLGDHAWYEEQQFVGLSDGNTSESRAAESCDGQ